jgi:hypothetical protein
MGLVVFLPACPASGDKAPAPGLRVPDHVAAQSLATAFFDAYVAVDVKRALSHLCDESPENRKQVADFIQRSQAEGSPFRVAEHQVQKVQTAWRDKTPLYVVTVAFGASGAGDSQGVSVRFPVSIDAQKGCVVDFMGGRKAPITEESPEPDEAPIPL